MAKVRITLFISLAAMFSISACAQSSSLAKSVLWRISGNGLTKPSYLFGSMDYICSANFYLTKSTEDCFAKSDKICFPLNIGDPALKKELSAAVIDRNKKLETYFAPADYDKVTRYAQDSLNLDFAKIQILTPLAVQPAIVKRLLECTDPVSYEKRLLENAQKAGKETIGLQTPGELMDDINSVHFNDMIAHVLTEMAKGSNYYFIYRTNVENAYQQQDIQAINTLFSNNNAFTKEQTAVLLDETNKRLVSRMPAAMQQSSVFFALSAFNLAGNQGIINLLRKAGYTVEPVY